MRIAIIAAAVALAGCATTPAGLAKSELDATLTSAKAPKDWAMCAVEQFSGSTQLRDDGTNWWIIVPNGYGVPIGRWDFKPTASGSVAELRTSTGVGMGKKIIQDCA